MLYHYANRIVHRAKKRWKWLTIAHNHSDINLRILASKLKMKEVL